MIKAFTFYSTMHGILDSHDNVCVHVFCLLVWWVFSRGQSIKTNNLSGVHLYTSSRLKNIYISIDIVRKLSDFENYA